MSLKQQLHDRLWAAYARWHSLREAGAKKHELKMRGIRECGDPSRYTRNLIFCGETLRTYERDLERFVTFAAREYGAHRLEEIGKRAFREFMDRAIQAGLAAKSLRRLASALSKFGSLTGQTAAFVGLAERYAKKIRELTRSGEIAGPNRATPSLAVLDRAIEILRERDAHTYHLAARIQRETACRRISATARITAASLLDANRILLVGKSGKEMTFTLSPDLYCELRGYLGLHPGPLADAEGYRHAYARAVKAVGGHVPGTHGVRRAAAREEYLVQYRKALAQGLSPAAAADRAAGAAIERLGHSRDRLDHRHWYLGR